MNPKLLAALREQTEARQAYNALTEEAAEADVAAADARVAAADQAIIEALELPANAPPELRDRISLGRYLHAFAEDRIADGAEAELRQELKLSDQAVPLEAMLPLPEDRADNISPQGTDGNALSIGAVNQTSGPLLTRVFTATDTAFLGVAMPTVPAGERVYPVMTDGTSPGMVARGSAGADAGAAKFAVVNASPHRLTGRYVFDLEGVATLGGLLESTLRADLRAAMGFALDAQVLAGSNAGGQVQGLLGQLDLTLPPGSAFGTAALANDVSAVMAWLTAKAMVTGTPDGKYARTEAGLRILVGSDTYSLLRSVYRGSENQGEDLDGIAMIANLGARLSRSFQIPASATATISPKASASTKKVQSLIVNMEPGAAVAPVWQGITMIRDPYSEASKAQVVLTAHMLFDFVMRRKDGWKRYAVRTEA